MGKIDDRGHTTDDGLRQIFNLMRASRSTSGEAMAALRQLHGCKKRPHMSPEEAA